MPAIIHTSPLLPSSNVIPINLLPLVFNFTSSIQSHCVHSLRGSMKKTFYHNFIPTKAEEEACKSQGTPFQCTRVLLEIRDMYPPPALDFHNPWKIKKTLTQYEVVTARFLVTFAATFDHFFRCWAMNMANYVVIGRKVSVVLWDVTDQNHQKTYCNGSVHFEMLPNDDFSISCMDLFRDRALSIDDEIGLFWDHKHTLFQFKLLRRAAI